MSVFASMLDWFTHIRIVERKVFANINLSNEGNFQFRIHTNVSSTCHFIIGSFERKGISLKYPLFPLKPYNRLPRIGSRGTSRTRSTAEKENQLLGDDISKQYRTTKLSFYAKEICATIIQVTSEYMCVEMIVVSVG
jgi:hypothetical protein